MVASQEILGDTNTLEFGEEVTRQNEETVDLVGLPKVLTHSDVDTLKAEIKEDTSFRTCKKLADQIARGYYWLEGSIVSQRDRYRGYNSR